MDKIQREVQPSNNCSFTCLGFTQQVAQYMSVASILITKPGPFTLAEAESAKCFVALDTSKILSWERANIKDVLIKKTGFVFSSHEELLLQLKQHLNLFLDYPKGLVRNTFYQEFEKLLSEIESEEPSSQ